MCLSASPKVCGGSLRLCEALWGWGWGSVKVCGAQSESVRLCEGPREGVSGLGRVRFHPAESLSVCVTDSVRDFEVPRKGA